MLLAFVDTPQKHRRLTIFPVVTSDEPQLSYLLMADALRRGELSLERAGPNEEPHLIARNGSSQPVLILDCETMEDRKLNHGTNQSVLLGPGSTTAVPVSCRDAGKWSCEELKQQFSSALENFPLLNDQVGILAFLDNHLLGLDVLGTPALFEAVHQRLLAGYLMTTLAAGENGGHCPSAREPDLRALALDLEEAERVSAPSFGNGEYATLQGRITGGELRHNGHLVHLSVFPNGSAA
jgi:hypothetical protein